MIVMKKEINQENAEYERISLTEKDELKAIPS